MIHEFKRPLPLTWRNLSNNLRKSAKSVDKTSAEICGHRALLLPGWQFPLPCSLSKNSPSASAIALLTRRKRSFAPASSLAEAGVEVVPVWNKSNREHSFIGSEPASVLAAAQEAVAGARLEGRLACRCRPHPPGDRGSLSSRTPISSPSMWPTPSASPPRPADVAAFVERHPELIGTVAIPGIDRPFQITRAEVERIAGKFLLAVQDAGKIYRHIAEKKGAGAADRRSLDGRDRFAADAAGAAGHPRGHRGRRNSRRRPSRRNSPAALIKASITWATCGSSSRSFTTTSPSSPFAVQRYGLPANLKLSVHSGSDKFSLYPIIRRVLPQFDAGLHLKTAGTTWLEELIGLAEAGGEGLRFSQGDLSRSARSSRRATAARTRP